MPEFIGNPHFLTPEQIKDRDSLLKADALSGALDEKNPDVDAVVNEYIPDGEDNNGDGIDETVNFSIQGRETFNKDLAAGIDGVVNGSHSVDVFEKFQLPTVAGSDGGKEVELNALNASFSSESVDREAGDAIDKIYERRAQNGGDPEQPEKDPDK